MAFSIKQLLFCMAVVAFGLVTLFNGQPVLGTLFDLLTLGILIATAYRAWLSHGESRAFRVGFLCWAVLYFVLYKEEFNVPVHGLLNLAHHKLQPPVSHPPGWGGYAFGGAVVRVYKIGGFYPNFYSVCHSLVLLLLGLVGGWITVYFYRKRQRTQQSKV